MPIAKSIPASSTRLGISPVVLSPIAGDENLHYFLDASLRNPTSVPSISASCLVDVLACGEYSNTNRHLMDADYAARSGFAIRTKSNPISEFILIGNEIKLPLVYETEPLVLRVGDHEELIVLDIVSGTGWPVILGAAWVRKNHARFDWSTGSVSFPDSATTPNKPPAALPKPTPVPNATQVLSLIPPILEEPTAINSPVNSLPDFIHIPESKILADLEARFLVRLEDAQNIAHQEQLADVKAKADANLMQVTDRLKQVQEELSQIKPILSTLQEQLNLSHKENEKVEQRALADRAYFEKCLADLEDRFSAQLSAQLVLFNSKYESVNPTSNLNGCVSWVATPSTPTGGGQESDFIHIPIELNQTLAKTRKESKKNRKNKKKITVGKCPLPSDILHKAYKMQSDCMDTVIMSPIPSLYELSQDSQLTISEEHDFMMVQERPDFGNQSGYNPLPRDFKEEEYAAVKKMIQIADHSKTGWSQQQHIMDMKGEG